MAIISEKISQFSTGTPQGTDLTPATDTTDTTQATSGTTKKFIRSDEFNFYLGAQGLRLLSASRCASTTSLTATYNNGTLGVGSTLTNAGTQAALVLDGVSVAVNDVVVIKDQVSQFQNGIYIVTTIGSTSANWVLTRSTSYDQASEVMEYDVILVDQGTTYKGKALQQTGVGPFIIGTTSIIFGLYATILTAGPGIQIVYSPGAITISRTGSDFPWTEVTSTSQAMSANAGYVANNAGLVTLSLPTTSAIGDLIHVVGKGAGGWLISQAASQQINIGHSASTLGASGSVASTNLYDSLSLVCLTANTIWSVLGGPQGNLTIV